MINLTLAKGETVLINLDNVNYAMRGGGLNSEQGSILYFNNGDPVRVQETLEEIQGLE